MTVSPTLSPVREPETMADATYRTLRDQLVLLQIAPGSPMNDDEIARNLGVGRTPVREALKRLEVDHLVAAFPRRGTFATAVDLTDIGEITEMRQRLEPLAAGRAARLASQAARDDMRELADKLDTVTIVESDRMVIMQDDMSVHRSIYAAQGNRLLEETMVRLDNLATRVWCAVLDRLPPLEEHIKEHSAILRSIVEGRAEDAEDLALHHATAYQRLVRSTV